MDQDIVTFARREYNLFLGERTAEDIKIAIASAYPGDWDAQRVVLRGRDLLTGLPRSVEVGADQIREAIEPSVQQIVDTIKDTIEETPPELVADIMDQGIVLAGGGALLAGLDQRIAEATQMPVHIADDPLTCVARGTGVVLEELATNPAMQRVLVADTYARAAALTAGTRAAPAMTALLNDRQTRRRSDQPTSSCWSTCLVLMVFSSSPPVQEIQNGVGVRLQAGPGGGRFGRPGCRLGWWPRSPRSTPCAGRTTSWPTENATLRAENAQALEIQRENQILTGLLQVQSGLGFKTVAATVIARETSEFRRVVTIDVGTDRGLVVGDVVVADGGALAGRVTDVTGAPPASC